MKKVACPFCSNKFVGRSSVEQHIDDKHEDMLVGKLESMPISQIVFNYANKYDLDRLNGKSVILGMPTKWNIVSKRYERFANDKEKELYKETFRKRMMTKYGKTHLLDDPNVQRNMLKNRKISGTYKYSDGSIFDYTGSYEHDFLVVMDHQLGWNSEDIVMPAPVNIPYTFDGKDHLYIPDVFIPSLNLIVEIKSEDNQHYRKRDIAVERTKDAVLMDSTYNYLKIYDKSYNEFIIDLMNLINYDEIGN